LFASKPRALGDFYLALSAFSSTIRCGHSFLNPANQTPAVSKALFDKPNRLPFAFSRLEGRMFVTTDLGSGHTLELGTEILTIYGVPTRDTLARMLPYMRTDGSNDARKIADLGIPGDEDQTSFDIFYSLLFPASASSARFGVRSDGHAATIACPLLTATDRDAALNPRLADSPYGWRFAVSGKTAILTMPTWAVFNRPWDWQTFIDTSVDTAIDRYLPGMIVDLRDNGGGLDCGAAILARLITAPLAGNSYSRHTRYRKVPERLSPFLTTWDPGFRDWGASAKGPDANGFFTLDAAEADIIKPAKRRYKGKVAVLIGPTNASTTFAFAALEQIAPAVNCWGIPAGAEV